MALVLPPSPLPAIHISPAPYQPPVEEPKSPFDCLSPISPVDDDGPRSVLLTPPPVLSPGRASPLSPLRPADSPVKGSGLERERFEALLKASRDRNAMIGGGTRRVQDLRKEIALKAHKSKQSERRALFLSKLQAPPSPTAAMTPKTPPESPAILHYSLPSPGLASPLALYESISEADQQAIKRQGWVEQVDFRLPEGERVKPLRKSVPTGRGKALPSLAQISARLSAQGHLPQIVHVTLPDTMVKAEPTAPKRRLPAFLQKNASTAAPAKKETAMPVPVVVVDPPVMSSKPRTLLSIGRLHVPTAKAPAAQVVDAGASLLAPAIKSPLKSPGAPPTPKIHITTTVVPRTSHTSPVDLTESNLNSFNSRARKAKDMLSTLRRRTVVPSVEAVMGQRSTDDLLLSFRPVLAEDDAEKLTRRRSSPAELPHRDRTGFTNPVLALPGAF